MTNFIVTYSMAVYDSFEAKFHRNKHFDEYSDEKLMLDIVDNMKKCRDVENIQIYTVKKHEGV